MLQSQTANNMQVSLIPAFSDNYIWAISIPDTKCIALVDPGDGDVCINYLNEHQLTLCAILITHHHADHVGGIKKLKEHCETQHNTVTVYGPKGEVIKIKTDQNGSNNTCFLKY